MSEFHSIHYIYLRISYINVESNTVNSTISDLVYKAFNITSETSRYFTCCIYEDLTICQFLLRLLTIMSNIHVYNSQHSDRHLDIC